MKLTNSDLNNYEARENQLYYQAVSAYLDKTDWDISEWLTDEEWKEYQELRKLLDKYN
jgi:succinate dehydrogenase flavin-adding protein (antitoxin of CptAB toxin-antitoxin module)